MAGLGKISLMQEPVAAVMAVMQKRRGDGIFVIYDLGGGTLDIAIAQSIGGRVSLLAHGGIAMCGGRDFDRMVLSNVVKPWLLDTFDLPEDFATDPRFRALTRMATWAAEKAKIELSARDDAVISLSRSRWRSRDAAGTEIYLDIPLQSRDLRRIDHGQDRRVDSGGPGDARKGRPDAVTTSSEWSSSADRRTTSRCGTKSPSNSASPRPPTSIR